MPEFREELAQILALNNFDELTSGPIDFPCGVHINSTDDYRPLRMDARSMDKFDLTQEIIDQKGVELIYRAHPVDLQKAITVCDYYLAHEDKYKSISYIQRIEDKNGFFIPYFTISKLSDEGLVSVGFDLNDVKLSNNTIEGILSETDFIRNNIHRFARLTKKETEIVQKAGEGNSWNYIAEIMNVTTETMKTYKKRIYKKLDVKQFHELYYYSKAFNLAYEL